MNAASSSNRNNKKVSVEDVDGKNICDLPDDLLRKIVSFLPIRDAVRTSVVSKKWEHLWKSVPNLEFNQYYFDDRKQFKNFVERVLLLRYSSNIKKFLLACLPGPHDAARIIAWISAAVKHNVEELQIGLAELEEPFALPRCLLTCDTLTKLDICLPCVFRLPAYASFPRLKILSLSNVIFSNENSTQSLINLPTLEELEIDECNWNNLKAVSISNPKLQRLTIIEKINKGSSTSVAGCHVRIYGNGITYFYFGGEFSNSYCLFKFSSLVDAKVIIPEGCKTRAREVASRACILLEGLSSSVKCLKLSAEAFQVLDSAPELFASGHPNIFRNLTTLQGFVFVDCNAFWHILYNSPHLIALKILGVSLCNLNSDNVEDEQKSEHVPPRPLPCLRRIEVENYYGGEKELSAVNHLLNIAAVATALDHVVITCRVYRGQGLTEMRKIWASLRDLPGWSKFCKTVEFTFRIIIY